MLIPLWLFAFALPAQSYAGPHNAGPKPPELIIACNEVRIMRGSTTNGQICLNYIAGIVDGQEYLTREKFPICFPPNVTLDQMVEALLKYAEAHPEVMRENGSAPMVTKALEQAFPCSVTH